MAVASPDLCFEALKKPGLEFARELTSSSSATKPAKSGSVIGAPEATDLKSYKFRKGFGNADPNEYAPPPAIKIARAINN